MSNDENSNRDKFCITATDAKLIYFLEASDLKWIPHKAVGGRCYGGNYKLFKPSALEEAATKKHGKGGIDVKRRARQMKQENERKRLEKACWERQRKAAIPKRPTNAWELFRKDNTDKIKSENPTIAYTDITKLMSSRYKALSKEERNVFDEKVALDKARYQQQLEAFEAKYGPLKKR